MFSCRFGLRTEEQSVASKLSSNRMAHPLSPAQLRRSRHQETHPQAVTPHRRTNLCPSHPCPITTVSGVLPRSHPHRPWVTPSHPTTAVCSTSTPWATPTREPTPRDTNHPPTSATQWTTSLVSHNSQGVLWVRWRHQWTAHTWAQRPHSSAKRTLAWAGTCPAPMQTV